MTVAKKNVFIALDKITGEISALSSLKVAYSAFSREIGVVSLMRFYQIAGAAKGFENEKIKIIKREVLTSHDFEKVDSLPEWHLVSKLPSGRYESRFRSHDKKLLELKNSGQDFMLVTRKEARALGVTYYGLQKSIAI